MLVIDHPERTIPLIEYFDNATQEFVTIKERHCDRMHLQLEHSLLSIAKWEGHWHEPFLGQESLEGEKLIDYIRCMTLNQQKNPNIYDQLSREDLLKIIAYMEDGHSAWVIKPKKKQKKSKRPETVESYYYAMFQYGIPLDFEKRHFNSLIAMIDFCDSKGGSSPGGGSPAKRSQKEIMEIYRAMNEKNRKRYNSKG